MAGMQITNFHLELLKTIMIFVAKSGATDLARAMSVCKLFMTAAMDKEVLSVANFSNLKLSGRYELLQPINGLVSRCAHVGNVAAQYLLAMTTLASCSELLDARLENAIQKTCPFMRRPIYLAFFEEHSNDSFKEHYMADPPCPARLPCGSFLHHELVRVFLCHCSSEHLVEMRPHLDKYLMYFIPYRAHEFGFLESIDRMTVLNPFVCLLKKVVELHGEMASELQSWIGYSSMITIGPATLPQAGEFNVSSRDLLKLLINWATGGVIHVEARDLKQVFIQVMAMFEEHRADAIEAFDKFFPPT